MRHFDPEPTWGNDDADEQCEEPISLRDRATSCPACGKPITDEMDSCPYCGDIIFRYLKDGAFAPRKGVLAKVISILIILLVTLATLGLLWQLIL